MPGVHRLGDRCSGHGCFPPRPNIEASDNFLVNGRGVVRVGDRYASHCCASACHIGAAQAGSGTYLVNGRGAIRQGDPITCGSAADECSGNHTIGG